MEDYQKRRLEIGLKNAYASGMLKLPPKKQSPVDKLVKELKNTNLTEEEKLEKAKTKAKAINKALAERRKKQEGRQPTPARCIRHFVNNTGEFYRVHIQRTGWKTYHSIKYYNLKEAVENRNEMEKVMNKPKS